jgi:hypothetical protein
MLLRSNLSIGRSFSPDHGSNHLCMKANMAEGEATTLSGVDLIECPKCAVQSGSPPNHRSGCIRLDTMFTVSASTVALKKNEIAPCSVVSRRIVLLVIWTSDTWAVIATTSE